MQHSIRGILFDKDDTLIDLAAFCRKPIYMTAAYLSQHMGKGTDEGWIERLAEASGFRGDTLLADAPIVSGTNRDLMEAWRTVLRTGGMQLSEELAQNALGYLQWACEHHGNLKARADLPALLQKLKARGIRLGVATSDDYLPAVQCLRALGVAHLFDAVFGADRVVIATQTYHLYRAVYDAQGVGMEAIGVPSDYGEYVNQSWYDFREIFARTKDFFQVLMKTPSTYVGDPISLDQSGDVTD